MSSNEDTQVTTVQRLKSLIEAIDLMSEEEEWTPTPKQWRRIKQMIETLQEVPLTQQLPGPQQPRPVRQQTQGAAAPQRGGVNPLEAGLIRFPDVPGGVPSDAQVVAGGGLTPPAVPAGRSSLGVETRQSTAVQSTDGVDNPPRSPGL